MSTFCRITGNARSLPKPCYFPLLPPITPAEAKKLCRITGKAHDIHHYVPIVAFAKPIRFDGVVGCKITQHEDLNYFRPIILKTNENESNFKFFESVLTKMKSRKKRTTDQEKMYVYNLDDHQAAVIITPEIEEAIRLGEFESFALSKDNSHLSFKIKQGRIIKVKVESVSSTEADLFDKLYHGEGQNKKTLDAQQKVLNDRNKRKQETMAMKKVFEEKEKKAEEEERKSTQKIKPKRTLKFDPQRRREKMEKMESLLKQEKENKAILLPKYDPITKIDPDEQLRYEIMLQDIQDAHTSSVNLTVYGSDFNWVEADQAETKGFDWTMFPHEEEVVPVEIGVRDITPCIDFVPTEIQSIDIAAAVETITAAPPVNDDILKAIASLEQHKLNETKDVTQVIEKAIPLKIVPEFSDIKEIVENSGSLRQGYLVEKNNKTEFVPKEKYKEGKWRAVSGAMVKIENTEKFITGQAISLEKEESFVAGQTIETTKGLKFIPGQTVVKNDKVLFVPGKMVLEDEVPTFVAGHIVDEADGQSFKPGQTIDRGDGKPIFMPGQTVITENGPKFVPGEIVIDEEGCQEFIPGLVMQNDKGQRFVPGQTFQTDGKLSFTPGQIIDTEEGPSFIQGKNVKMANGETTFIRGNLKQNETGEIHFEPEVGETPIIKEDLSLIPNEALKPVAIPESGIVGIVVNPTNTSNIQAGEKIYGSIVETEDSILFYTEGKLPEDIPTNGKVITGQLIVGENIQKFIPGKMVSDEEGQKFVPGQIVCTSHGEEFVPGQLVETGDGPKFVPGQVVLTSEGEKFVPGQVIYEKEGPKFVPGHIIQAETGATFIPGQMMNTNEGQKFIPGQLVETKEGPMFVPGQVLETPDGPRFLPGTIVETEEGLKYVPSEADDHEDDLEISFQAFDISPEELMLITNPPIESHYETRRTPISGQQGLIDSETLNKLAIDTVVVHGRTPEPTQERKRSKKKGVKVAFDAPESESSSSESEDEDSESDKVDILKKLMKASSTVSNVKRERELRNVLDLIGADENKSTHYAEVEAISYIISSDSENGEMLRALIGEDEQIIADILSNISNLDKVERNDHVTKIINNALKSVITRKCDKKINDMIERLTDEPESLFIDSRAQVLLSEAVGIVYVTGDVEAAKLLEKFISEPSDPNCLKENKDVLAVLRQLLILHEIAHFNPEVASALAELQTNPESITDTLRIKRLIRKTKRFIRKEKVELKPFNIRHVVSSKDIPTTIFEQLRENKEEAERFIEDLPDELIGAIIGDKRCGEKLLDSLDSSLSGTSTKAIHKFRKGMVVVVTKDNMQAVIPRHHSRSVCYGIVPYLLIDEDGFKFFERGLTGRKLAPTHVIRNTWYEPEPYCPKGLLHTQQVDTSGQEYKYTLFGKPPGMDQSSLYYTSLLPSAGPEKLSYTEAFRRASRESSVASYRPSASSSATPSRRSSVSSLYEPYCAPTVRDSSRRSSLTSGPYSYSRSMTPSAADKVTSNGDSYSTNEGPSYHKSLVPIDQKQFQDEEEIEPRRINRSDTVANLLDKYSNFSLAKDYYGYKSDSGKKYAKSTHVPESSMNGDKGDIDSDQFLKNRRKTSRPFSDIYEVDELGTPTNENPIPSKTFSNLGTNNDTSAYSNIFDDDFDEDKYIASLRNRQEQLKASSKYEPTVDEILTSKQETFREKSKPPKPVSSKLSREEDILDPKSALVPLPEGKSSSRRRRRRYDNIEDTLYKPTYQSAADDVEPLLVPPIPRRTKHPLSKIKLDDEDDDQDNDDGDSENVSRLVRSYKRNYTSPSMMGSYSGSYGNYGNPPPPSPYGYNSYSSRGGAMGGMYQNHYGNPPQGPYMGGPNYGQGNYMGMGYNPRMPPPGAYGGNPYPNYSNYQSGPYGAPPGGGNYPPSSGMGYSGAPTSYGGGYGTSYGPGNYGGGNTSYNRSYSDPYSTGTYPQGSYANDSFRTPAASSGIGYTGMNQSSAPSSRSEYGTGLTTSSTRPTRSSYSSPSPTTRYFDDEDDDEDDDSSTVRSYDTKIYNPKNEQRKLATKLARQYLSNDLSDNEEE